MQIPIDDGIKAGSDTNMRRNNKIRFAIFLSVAFVVKIARGEYRDKWKSYFRFDYAEPYSIFVVTKIMKGECRDVKNGCFSLFYRAVFCLVFTEEKISRRKKRYCLHGDSVFHLGEIVWERLPKSNYLFTFVENIKIDIM